MFFKKRILIAFIFFVHPSTSASQPLIPSKVSATVRLESTPSEFNLNINIPAAEKLSQAISTIPPFTYTLGVMGLGCAVVYCGWKQVQKNTNTEKFAGYALMAVGIVLACGAPWFSHLAYSRTTLV